MDYYGDTLDAVTTWAEWLPLCVIRTQINPGRSGVYLARYADTGHIFYVGEAHKRGVRERLDEYRLSND